MTLMVPGRALDLSTAGIEQQVMPRDMKFDAQLAAVVVKGG